MWLRRLLIVVRFHGRISVILSQLGLTKDRGFSEQERARFQQLFRDHRNVVLENAGHFIQEDEPLRIANEIRVLIH